MNSNQINGYKWANAELNTSHGYLLPAVFDELNLIGKKLQKFNNEKKIFELGCGNGSVSSVLERCGWDVTGIDPSIEGITQANTKYPNIKLHEGSAYDDLVKIYGQYPVVTSLEVVEHLYDPRSYAKNLYNLLQHGGTAIISTPYHGYIKNIALALTGNMDKHFTVLWDHGHIKFWSIETLKFLLEEAGFVDIHFKRVGRIPILAKSMIAIATKP